MQVQVIFLSDNYYSVGFFFPRGLQFLPVPRNVLCLTALGIMLIHDEPEFAGVSLYRTVAIALECDISMETIRRTTIWMLHPIETVLMELSVIICSCNGSCSYQATELKLVVSNGLVWSWTGPFVIGDYRFHMKSHLAIRSIKIIIN